MRKNVWQVLNETGIKHFELKCYAYGGGYIGSIKNDELEHEMALDLRDMKVSSYKVENNKLIIDIHEVNNMPYIKLMYRVIAKNKLFAWEEHGL